jgi:hypothetical protein
MKRPVRRLTFLFLILFLGVWRMAYSQQFNGGVLAGFNVSQVDGDTWEGYHKAGFQAGGFVSLRLSPHSSFQMEMEFFQKGSRKNSDPDKGDMNDYLLRLNYLEIPVLYQFTFAKICQAEVGPAFDILLGYKELSQGLEVPEMYPMRTFNLGGILGFGCYITPHLKATARYSYSLTSIRKPADPPGNGWRHFLFETGQFNNVLSLNLSWNFKPFEK